jgi:hypothetical protein
MDVWVMMIGANDDAGSKVYGAYATKDAARPDFEKVAKDLTRFSSQVPEMFAADDEIYVEVGLDYVELRRFPLTVEAGQPAITT